MILVIRTVISTIDVLLGRAVVMTKDLDYSHKKLFIAFILMNLLGVWL